MRELSYYVATSLDGRISGPDDDFSAFPTEGDHIETVFREYTDIQSGQALEMLGLTPDLTRFDTVVMGWNTYALGLPYGVVDPYPHLRQYVASRQPRDLPAGVNLTADPVRTVQNLKAETVGSGVYLCGGGRLASSLLDEIDHLVLKVNPVVLGEGPGLFDHPYDARTFELTVSTPYRSGVVINEYRRR